MQTQTISTKELRESMPLMREKLENGMEFIIIHRSRPIAIISPFTKKSIKKISNISEIAGGHTFQKDLKKQLTPSYISELANERYE